MEIYVHIPFCAKKCNYCDFLSGPADEKVYQLYVDALVKEIEGHSRQLGRQTTIETIYFGGGTPSQLGIADVKAIMDAVRDTFDLRRDAEITFECNPCDVTAEYAEGRILGTVGQ